jgi:hypothetical protein
MGALTTGVVLAILLFAAIWIFQRRLIYFPFGEVPDPRLFGLAAAEPVVLPTADGLRLHGWLLPPREPRAGTTILVFNGNAGHRGFRARFWSRARRPPPPAWSTSANRSARASPPGSRQSTVRRRWCFVRRSPR